MDKITFLGAGSTVFAKNVLGDCMQTDALREFEYALYDIDEVRLEESYSMLSILNKNTNSGKAKIKKYTDRVEALRDAKYVINAIQVGGYDPCTITDFEIPEKYGLRQTIGDTVGIGGIFRALRTIPVMQEFVRDMEKVCPDAIFLNYTNPMAMLTMAMLKSSPIQTIGICHSVQVCVPQLLYRLGLPQDGVRYKIAGVVPRDRRRSVLVFAGRRYCVYRGNNFLPRKAHTVAPFYMAPVRACRQRVALCFDILLYSVLKFPRLYKGLRLCTKRQMQIKIPFRASKR